MDKNRKFKSLILAFRPKTLTAALVPCFSATFLAKGLGYQIPWNIFFYALFSAFFIQIGTNLVNDAVDYKKGADTEKRIGPQRITQMGVFSYKQVLIAAGICFLMALILGVPIVIKGGIPFVIIGLLSIAMGYSYTMGPFPLAYLGLGDLFVIIFFGLIAVSGMGFLITENWSLDFLILGLQVGFHGTVLIAINNLRDFKGDALVNKKTLAVRFGERFSKFEILILVLAPYFLNYYWINLFGLKSVGLSFLSLFLGVFVAYKIFKTEPSPIYNKYLGLSALHQMIFAIFLSLGFWWVS